MRKGVAVASLIVGMSAHQFGLAAEPPRHVSRPLAEFSTALEELAKASRSAVVQISVRSRRQMDEESPRRAGFVAEHSSSASGVILDPNGYIVTNAHVVEGARSIDISVADPSGNNDHKHFSAKIIGMDQETDLAVLKIDGTNLPTLGFVNSGTLKQGQIVVALGSPLGLDNSLTVGFVSAPVRYLRGDSPLFYVQTDAPINPGNSGGPLLDTEGRIAGINTMILTQSGGSEGIGLAIPSNVVRNVYEHLRKDGHISRGAIGVISQDITPVLASALGLEHHSGVMVSDVRPHSSAEAAGLQPGDIVLGLNGTPVREGRQLLAALFERSSGEEITLEIQRGKERMKKPVMVLERKNLPTGLAELATEKGQLIRPLGILALTVDERVTAVLPDLRRMYGVAVAAIPAEYAVFNPGLAAGDVIYELNGKRIDSVEQLTAELGAKKTGDPIALLVEHEDTLGYVPFEYE
jgi:serine protease Do